MRIRYSFFAILFLSGCLTLPTAANRRSYADQLAQTHGFKKTAVRTTPFHLTTYQKIDHPGELIRFYIEGDGYAFVTPARVSGDPTPKNPVALELAVLDPAPNVVYLARPCQYTIEDPACEMNYWTGARFSEEVISSMNSAIDAALKKTGSHEIEIIGFSGGGAVGALIAARRSDVRSFRTVGGNLDPEAVNEYHEVSPLDGSLDPVSVASEIKNISQIHFTGSDDKVIPAFVADRWASASGDDACIETVIVPGADHKSGWKEAWNELLKIPFKSCH